jgi:hypothetical protein
MLWNGRHLVTRGAHETAVRRSLRLEDGNTRTYGTSGG